MRPCVLSSIRKIFMQASRFLLLILTACAPAAHLRAPTSFDDASASNGVAVPVDSPESIDDYVTIAAQNDPALRAAHARWQAAHSRAQASSPWPRPVVSYGVFLRPVETRVGPQRQRVGVRVPITWGSQRRAERDAGAWVASRAGRIFQARLLELRADLAALYWSLWRLDRDIEDAVREEELVRGLEEASRIRLESNQGSLSQLQQMGLRRALAEDRKRSLEAERRRLRARFAAQLDWSPEREIRITALPPRVLALPERDALLTEAARHPLLEAREDRARSHEARARSYAARRLPGLSVNVDFIDVAPAQNADVAGSGNNALSAGLAISVPVDARVFRRRADAERSEAAAERADAEGLVRSQRADIDALLTTLSDAERRSALYQDALLPQAEAAFESTLARYVSAGNLGEVFVALDTLFEVRSRVHRTLAAYALARNELERVTGLPLEGAHREPAGAERSEP